MTVPFALDRSALARVLAVANGKGGVGKTSLADHIAARLAAAGRRVLLIEMDPQNNSREDLGYEGGDDGESLLTAMMIPGAKLHIVRDVRPGLDLVPAGGQTNTLADYIRAQQIREDDDEDSAYPRGSTLLKFAAVIAEHTAGYDLVIVDCPPANNHVLQDAALSFARYLLIPTHSDKSSRMGLAEMSKRVRKAQRINPMLTLLGVVLFGVGTRASVVRHLARQWIEAALGDNAPVFDTFIRHAESVAFDVREQGRLAFEIDPYDGDGDEPGDDADDEPDGTPRRRVTPAGALGGDYRRVSAEVLRRLIELEVAQR